MERLGADGQFPAVQADDLPREAESDARAVRFRREEGDEDVLQGVGRNAGAVVRYFDEQPRSLPICFQADSFLRPFRHGLHGVFQQIDEHLRQHFFVRPDLYFGLEQVGAEVDVLPLQVFLVERPDVFYESGQREILEFRLFQSGDLPVGRCEVDEVLPLALDGFQPAYGLLHRAVGEGGGEGRGLMGEDGRFAPSFFPDRTGGAAAGRGTAFCKPSLDCSRQIFLFISGLKIVNARVHN